MPQSCNGCYFWRNMDGNIKACHYAIDMNELRGCSVENCTKRMTEAEYIKVRSEQIYSKVYKRYCCGATVSAISREIKLPPNTVIKIIREMKSKNESQLEAESPSDL